jgi:hypothetical protein
MGFRCGDFIIRREEHRKPETPNGTEPRIILKIRCELESITLTCVFSWTFYTSFRFRHGENDLKRGRAKTRHRTGIDRVILSQISNGPVSYRFIV